ncbi:MAG: ORF6N domain-containing protein [Flavobacteriales bacterium]|nr:ORF6N domain-containing protein [Flavobacteriales bacterium]
MREESMSSALILSKIYLIRGMKVMLDRDLAELYGVETKSLKRAVKRNIDIFPSHFMFELTKEEHEVLRCQNGTSKTGSGGTRYLPIVFSEHGVLQLSHVLRSKKAKLVSIRITELFIKMREALSDNLQLKLDVEKIKKKLENQDKNIELVFNYLDELIEKQDNTEPRKRIGFKK